MLSHPQDQSLKAGHGFAPSEWAVLAHGGAPALRSPPRQGPRSPAPCRAAAPGCRLTHARAGSGGTCVVPPPTRGCCATGCHRAAGARCQWGGGGWPPWAPRPVGSASPPPPGGRQSPSIGLPEVPPCSGTRKRSPCRWRRASVPKPTITMGHWYLVPRAGGLGGAPTPCTVGHQAGRAAPAWPWIPPCGRWYPATSPMCTHGSAHLPSPSPP